MEFKTSQLFPKSFNDDFRSILKHDFTEYVEAGGRGSCKSSFISVVIPILMMQNRDFNALVLRKVSNTLRDSVFPQLQWAVDKLGVSHLFKFTLSPLQITYTPTGQTIFFRGADDPVKIKSIKTSRGYIALTWFEETAEFTMYDIQTIKLSSMRGGSVFYNFFSYNPPSSTRSWVNTEFRKPRKDRLFHESNYLTVPSEWLGDAFLFEAEEMKRTNERAYRNIFLGEPTGTGTNVFENVEIREITQKEKDSFEWFYYGVDWGYYPDYFRFVECSYSIKTRELYVLQELSLQKHNNLSASNKMKEFCERNNIPLTVRITADSSEPKSVSDFREYGWDMRGAIKGAGSRDTSFKWLQGLKKIVIDPIKCPYASDEFALYEYVLDKRTGDVIEGFPDGQPDHSIDAIRYALEEIWRSRGN